MKEHKGITTIKGNPIILLGDEIKVGDKAPDFEAINNDMKPVKLSSFKGKIVIISAVHSLDTAVCDTETRRFNDEATRLGDTVQVLTVSMDLPFAQKRWCGAAGITRVQTLSDHRDANFGTSYGILIKDLRLLARAVFVVDGAGIVRYKEIVKDVATEPDYKNVLDAVAKIL